MEKKIEEAIEDSLNEEGIELLSVNFGEEDGSKTLFITIDSKNGVDTDLCVKATKIINPIILEIALGNILFIFPKILSSGKKLNTLKKK